MVVSRYTFVNVLIAWLWLVSVAAGIGGGIGIYYAARSLGRGEATALGVVGGIAAATPYLTVIALVALASEVAQGVTWITAFLHDRGPGEEETDLPTG